MVKVFQGTEQEYYLDGYIKQNLDVAKKVIREDWDMVFVVDGTEGAGKSVLAQQLAFYADPTLTVERIVFNDNDFKKAITAAKPYESIILDEAYGGLASRSAMSKVNKSIVQMLTVIRAKNLFIFIVLPTFFDLDKYVALWRSRALITVYTREGFKRGAFKFYNAERKKNLYVNGKKFYNYHAAKPNFRGAFTNHYTVDEKSYRDKKAATALDNEANNSNLAKQLTAASELRATIIKNVNNGEIGLTQTQIGGVLEIAQQTISKYINDAKNKHIDNISDENLLKLMKSKGF